MTTATEAHSNIEDHDDTEEAMLVEDFPWEEFDVRVVQIEQLDGQHATRHRLLRLSLRANRLLAAGLKALVEALVAGGRAGAEHPACRRRVRRPAC